FALSSHARVVTIIHKLRFPNGLDNGYHPSAIRAAATCSTITQPFVNDCIASINNKEDIPKRGAALVLIGALAEATDARLIGSFDNVVSALCRAMTADTASDLRLLPLTIRVLLGVL
ncbi:hypothetical protein FOZ62_022656, partial [Perkinsus olseni]